MGDSSFGTKGLTHILENVHTLIHQLFPTKQKQGLSSENTAESSTSIAPKNHGLDILKYMLQNTDNLLQNMIKKEPAKTPLSDIIQATSQTTQKIFKPFADSIGQLNEYFTPDLEEPDGATESEVRNEPQQMMNLSFGPDTLDFYKGDNVSIATNGLQNLSEGRIANPIENNITEETKIRLVHDETVDNVPKYKFVVEETPLSPRLLRAPPTDSKDKTESVDSIVGLV
jgi:hypothetical protein